MEVAESIASRLVCLLPDLLWKRKRTTINWLETSINSYNFEINAKTIAKIILLHICDLYSVQISGRSTERSGHQIYSSRGEKKTKLSSYWQYVKTGDHKYLHKKYAHRKIAHNKKNIQQNSEKLTGTSRELPDLELRILTRAIRSTNGNKAAT